MFRISTTLVIMLGVWLASGSIASAQIQFEADYLFLKQSGRPSSSLISGPDGINSGDINFGYQSGYRFAVNGGSGWWEVESVFAQIDDWSDSSRSVLTNPLVFDDSYTSGVLFPGTPPNHFGFGNSLSDAANNPNAAGQDETTESERLQGSPNSFALLRANSRYRDFELNFGSNRNRAPYRFAIGWRNLQLNENAALLASGTFDAIDNDGTALGGPNDGLSDAALTAAGYALLSGTADGFDAAAAPLVGPDQLLTYFGGQANNELNGIQGVFAARVLPSDVWLLEAVAKAGVYHNSVKAQVSEILIGSGNDDSIYRQNFNDQKGTGAFVGSLGFRSLLPVTDFINLVTGYEVLWVSGVALGTEQFHGLHTNLLGGRGFTAQANDSVFLHGGRVGVEVSW